MLNTCCFSICHCAATLCLYLHACNHICRNSIAFLMMIFNSYHINFGLELFNTLKYCLYRQSISLSSRQRISEPQSCPSAPVQTVLGFRAHHFECYQHWSVSHSHAHQLKDRWCLSNCPVIQSHLCSSSSPEYGHPSLVIR